MSKPKFYWDYGQGEVELEKTEWNCPILKGADDNIVIESWWVDSSHTNAINFAYARNGICDRDLFFAQHDVNPQDMRWLTIPKSEYEELEYRFGGLLAESEEENV